MARKTINLTDVLTTANNMLANSEDHMTREREGIAALLESLLHESDVYAGFGYLPSAGVKHEPSYNEAWARYRAVIEIARANGLTDLYESDKAVKAPEWEDYCDDDTRRVYYTHSKLR